MSSPGENPKRGTRPPPRPPTPGPVFNNAGELLDPNLLHGYQSDPPSRLASVDLATSPSGSSVWIEMDHVPPTSDAYADSRRLLGKTRSRSTSVSSASSDASSVLAQGSVQRYIGTFAKGLTSLAGFAVVQKLFSPVERFSSKIRTYQSRSRFHGWRMGVVIGSCMSAIILFFNIAVVIIVAATTGFKDDTAELPFFYDSLTMSWISSGIHILINALSTILLAASNYTMQVLTSPTRKDLDTAHAQGQWFDIGVLSSHNLKRIPRKQLLSCLVIGFTSIPLHLFYNSAAIYIASTNDYQFNLLKLASPTWREISSNSSYTALSNPEWQRTYTSDLIQYGDLYLAFNETASNITYNSTTGYPSEAVDLPSDVDMTMFRNNPASLRLGIAARRTNNWVNLTFAIPDFDSSTLAGIKYAHIVDARALVVPSRSRIQLSLRFMIVVIICNAMKLAMMLWVLFLEKSDFIVTLGDGAASYLEYPDPNTKGLCVLSKDAIMTMCGPHNGKDKKGDVLDNILQDAYGTWRKRYHAYSNALDRDRELGSSFIFIVIGVTPILIAALGFSGAISNHWGSSSPTILGGSNNDPQNTLILAWLANAPQLVLSFCYLAINSECTSIAGAREWNQLGIWRKGLRVTKPTRNQRSTYFLQLPYKISLPLALLSGGVHWLLSQSLFLVRIDYVERNGLQDPDRSRFGVGISGLSFVTLYVAFCVLFLGVAFVGRRRLTVRIPFAASCSLVISAACHPPSDDKDAHSGQVKWGVVKERMLDGELHCTLSSQAVSRPKEGTRYR